jgi:hypothetical protein
MSEDVYAVPDVTTFFRPLSVATLYFTQTGATETETYSSVSWLKYGAVPETVTKANKPLLSTDGATILPLLLSSS